MTDLSGVYPIGCAVMAAGNSARFGRNKLLAELNGKRLIDHALEAVPRELFEAVVVVTQYDEVAALTEEYGFTCLWNDHPEWGASYTVRLAVGALAPACRGILFQAADQPFLSRRSLSAMACLAVSQPEKILAMAYHGRRGSPCLFPERFYSELTALQGDCGGSRVIRDHPEDLLLFEVDERELLDIDTPEVLAALQS